MTRRSAWWGTALATALVVAPSLALVWLGVSGFARQEEAVRDAVLSGIRDSARAAAEAAAREVQTAAQEALRAVAGTDDKDVLERIRSTSRRPDLVEDFFLASPEGDILYPGDLGASRQVVAYEERAEDASGRRLLAETRLLERAESRRAEALEAYCGLTSVAYGRNLRGEALADLAALHFRMGAYGDAAEAYRRLLSDIPAGFVDPAVRVLARFQVGAALEAAKRPAEAEAEYRSLLADALGEEPTLPGIPATRWFVGQTLGRLRGMAGAGQLSAEGPDALASFERLERAKLRPGGLVDALRSWVLPALRREGLPADDAVRGVLDVQGGRPVVVLYRRVREGGRDLAFGFVARLDRLAAVVAPRLGGGDGVAFALEANRTRIHGPAGDPVVRLAAPAPLGFAEVLALPTSPETLDGPVRRQRLLGRLLLGLLALVLGAGIGATLRGRAQAHRFARLQADFVARLSHDLKTPLALIRLYAETLLRPECDRAKAAEYHRVIARESERLTHMVNNLLDFSRVQEGRRVYHRRPEDLVRIVHEAAEALRPRFVEEGFTLHEELPANEVVAAVDADAVASAVANLLDNARKYSGASREVRLRLVAEDGRARIEVADRGIGVPAAERERVFERFHRGTDPRVVEQKGAGLGLALVRHVAEGHGGRAWLAPNRGEGTIASVELPTDDVDL